MPFNGILIPQEANAELERLVAEKEDLAAAFSDLKEEVKELSFSLNEQRQKNEDLKERLIRPNIIVSVFVKRLKDIMIAIVKDFSS